MVHPVGLSGIVGVGVGVGLFDGVGYGYQGEHSLPVKTALTPDGTIKLPSQ